MQSAAGKRKRSWLYRLARAAVLGFVVLVGLVYLVFVLPFWGIPFNGSRHGRVPITPPWALECWLWEDDVNTEAYVKELLEGYRKWDLPVRTVLIDSPWSLRYNDFKIDETRYPDPEKFFHGLKSDGYRVVLWMTCMVNSRNDDTGVKDSREFFEQARGHGYLAANGRQLGWWKGRGGFIDYTNPQAMEWWQGLQQQVLDWGVDGWKLDGCDTFFSGQFWKLPVPFNRAHSGWLTTRQYMDHYARDEYRHGLSRNAQFAILVRALDGHWAHPEGFAPLDAATVTWMGDNRHTWNYKDRGIQEAITDVLLSARLGYCVTGTDVAGYHGRSHPGDMSPATARLLADWQSPADAIPAAPGDFGGSGEAEIAPNIYIRWAEFSTFCGLFLNGGHGDRRLWKRSRAELEIIRKFSWLHTELLPYMFSQVVECHNGAPPLIRPAANGDFHYLFGPDFLVAPIHQDTLRRTVSLPSGHWRYFFQDRDLLSGPQGLTRDFPLDEYPVFIRSGAIVPLNVSRAYTSLGDRDSEGFRTWLIYPEGKSEFTLWHPEAFPELVQTKVQVDSADALRIEFSGKHEPHILRIFAPAKPAKVTLDDAQLSEGDAWRFDAANSRLIIRTRDYAKGAYGITWQQLKQGGGPRPKPGAEARPE